MKRNLPLLAISSLLISMSATCADSDHHIDDSNLRRGENVGPNVQLFFRTADGVPLSERNFLIRANHGEQFWSEQPAYDGKLVITLGTPPLIAETKPPHGRASKLLPGDRLPSFELVTVDGKHLSNSMFKGKLTLIDFFGVSCGTCIEEIPALDAFKRAHPDVQTLAIAADPDIYVRDFVRIQHFSWPTVANAARLYIDLELWAAPTYALVDANGRMIAMKWGAIMGSKGQKVTENDIAQWVDAHTGR
jgi:thiol-disulfide isomerase/thioredoxin